MPGGQVGRYRRLMVGAPVFVEGEEVVLFLKGRRRVPFPFGLSQGVYRVVRAASGQSLVTPPTVAEAPGRVVRGDPSRRPMELAGIRTERPRNCGGTRQGASARVRYALLAILLCLSAQPAQAYLHLTFAVGSTPTPLKWDTPRVRWFATDRGAPGVSASQFQTAVASAFGTWEAVPTASIAFQFAGFTGAVPFDDDGISVFGFDEEPDLDRVLGATTFVVDILTGEIVESDVFFNSIFTWSTAAAGEQGRFDLQSVAVHEIGHFVGLGHSALGETEIRPEGGRRVLASRRRHVPDLARAGRHRGPDAAARRYRGRLRPVSRWGLPRPHGGDRRRVASERQQRHRRAHRGLRSQNARAGRRVLAR